MMQNKQTAQPVEGSKQEGGDSGGDCHWMSPVQRCEK